MRDMIPPRDGELDQLISTPKRRDRKQFGKPISPPTQRRGDDPEKRTVSAG
jgi:hypothetical protein